ncbi:hypothetical protein AQUCO_05600096v1 [Aquilegia coerulea]|uniref:Eukaryotic translation initiation factor 3 subunit C N-terminal domain-containing protein n=1 Tax=Aquilegia coerulea TaxID=218851 RepID=A0A2G5CGJ4_AQUCA|nr:hypothetical protein AQUCO_05600096v1 [Aquilegia coerulea]
MTTTITASTSDHHQNTTFTWQEIEEKISKACYIKSKEEAITQLKLLIDLAPYPAQKIRILILIIDQQLVWDHESIWDNVSSNTWNSCAQHFFLVLDILHQYPNLKIKSKLAKFKYYDKEPDFDGPIHLRGDLVQLLLEGFSFQFHDTLKHIRFFDPEYHQRLQEDEPTLILLCLNLLDYFEQTKDFHAAAQVALKLLSLLHYKPQVDYDRLMHQIQLIQHRETGTSKPPHHNADDEVILTVDVDQGHTDPPPCVTPKLVPRRPSFPNNSRILIDKLVDLVCKYGGDDETKLFAMLYDIYHLAIIDRFQDSFRAMTNFLDKVQDVNSEYLLHFNRALAQLGLCAFRAGCIAEARIYLSWLFGFGRVDKLLGQSVSHIPYEDRGPTPVGQGMFIACHMRINLELLEAVNLVCSIFPEDPYAAANTHVAKGKVRSQEICTFLQSSESEVSRCLPERVCDFVMDASRDLRKGDFQKAFMVIESLKLPSLFSERVDVLEMLKTQIQEEAWRNQQYLLTSTSSDFSSLDHLTHKSEPSEAITQVAS